MLTKLKNQIAIGVLVAITSSSVLATDSEVLKAEISRGERLEQQIYFAQNKINHIKEAVWAYYAENSGWPSSLSQITTGSDPFYSGTFSTSLGAINGTPSAGRYIFTVSVGANAPDAKISQIKRFAAQMGGDFTSSSNSAVISVDVPHGASMVKNMLSRVADESGQNLNTMGVDLEMSNYDIDGVADIFGNSATISNNLKSQEIIAVNVNASSTTTADIADLQKLTSDQLTVRNGVADTFTVSQKLTATTGTVTKGQSKDLTADSITAVNASANSMEVTNKLTGNLIDYRVGLVTNQLTTPEIVVDDITHTPDLSVTNIASRDASAITIDDAIQFVGSVTTQNVGLNANIVQQSNKNAVFDSNVTTKNLTVMDNSVLGGVNNTSAINVDGSAEIGNDLTVKKQTTVDGLVSADSLTVNGKFQTEDLTSNSDVSADNGIFVGKNRITDNNGEHLYENGQRLESRYLKKGAKADNTQLLDGKSLSSFAQLDTSNTFTKAQTFNNLTLGSNLKVGGHLIANASGKLYERGVALSSIYETKSSLNSEKQARLAELESLEAELLAKVGSIKDLGADVSSLESKNTANTNITNQLYANAQTLVSTTALTKANATQENSSVSSLVSNTNSQYSQKRTHATNIVSGKSESTNETDYEQSKGSWHLTGKYCNNTSPQGIRIDHAMGICVKGTVAYMGNIGMCGTGLDNYLLYECY